MNILGTPCRL